jgi:predicted LPLAT superfamily acyltransferase
MKVTGEPVVALNAPIPSLVRVHEYVVPAGHFSVQTAVAVKVVVPEGTRLAEIGLTVTEVSVLAEAFTVSNVDATAVFPLASVTFAETVKLPVAEGVHWSTLSLTELHPGGRLG